MFDHQHRVRQKALRDHPEHRWHVIASFIADNAELARLLRCVISCHGGPAVTASKEAQELAEQITAKISQSFLDWFGHEIIASKEPVNGGL